MIRAEDEGEDEHEPSSQKSVDSAAKEQGKSAILNGFGYCCHQ